eukprot:2947064-Prymnesium_polylepis.2
MRTVKRESQSCCASQSATATTYLPAQILSLPPRSSLRPLNWSGESLARHGPRPARKSAQHMRRLPMASLAGEPT